MRPFRRNPERFSAAAAVWVVLALAQVATTGNITLSEFRTQGGSAGPNRPAWELHGGQAAVSGAIVKMKDLRLTFHLEGADKAVMTSPRCTFNQTEKTAHSGAPIRVESSYFTLTGEGYDLRAEKQRLLVRRNVHLTMHRRAGTWKAAGDDEIHTKDAATDPAPMAENDREPDTEPDK